MNMRMRVDAPKGIRRPSGDEGHKLLNSVWQHLARTRRWPSFGQIDRILYREGIDFERAVAQLSSGLLMGIDLDFQRRPPQLDQIVHLSLAGAVYCDDTAAEIKTVVSLARLAAVIERDWEPQSDDLSAASHPYVDTEILQAHPSFDLGVLPPAEVVYRAALLTVSEPWRTGLSFRPEDLYWRVSFDRSVRPFARVTGLADYWQRRIRVLPLEPATPADPTFMQAPIASASVTPPTPAPAPELTLSIRLHPEVAAVAAERFEKGQFTDAVRSAFQAVEHRVQNLSGLTEVGTRLMGMALGSATPKLVVTRATGPSLQSEREGFRDLFKGSMEALRNPRSHGPHFADDPEEAQEMLALANLLMRRLDEAEAKLTALPTQPAGTP